MIRRSNKTAHVLKLITTPDDNLPQDMELEEEVYEAAVPDESQARGTSGLRRSQSARGERAAVNRAPRPRRDAPQDIAPQYQEATQGIAPQEVVPQYQTQPTQMQPQYQQQPQLQQFAMPQLTQEQFAILAQQEQLTKSYTQQLEKKHIVQAPEVPTGYVNLTELAARKLAKRVFMRLDACACSECVEGAVLKITSSMKADFVLEEQKYEAKKQYLKQHSKDITAKLIKMSFKNKNAKAH